MSEGEVELSLKSGFGRKEIDVFFIEIKIWMVSKEKYCF